MDATMIVSLRAAARRLTLALVTVAAGALPAGAQVTEYYHLDGLGSVRAVTDQNQVVLERHDYLPFGEECTVGACAGNPQVGAGQAKKFTGKERDTETGLDYFGARYYRSSLGRFTSVDPALQLDRTLTEPQLWNRYVYGRNHPLRFVDPDGRADVPAPVGPNGEPLPPPIPVPGAPDVPWKFSPDPQNPRGGTWGPGKGWKGPNPPKASWDPRDGNWDVDRGGGEPREHYSPEGKFLTPEQAHPGDPSKARNAPKPEDPSQRTLWEKAKAIPPTPVVALGTTAIVIYIVLSEGSRVYPPRNLVPIP